MCMVYIFVDYMCVWLFPISVSIGQSRTYGRTHVYWSVCVYLCNWAYLCLSLCVCFVCMCFPMCAVYMCYSTCIWFIYVILYVCGLYVIQHMYVYLCVFMFRILICKCPSKRTYACWEARNKPHRIKRPPYLGPAAPKPGTATERRLSGRASAMLRATASVPEQGLTTPDSWDYYTSLSLPKTREVKLFIPVFNAGNRDSIWRLKRLRRGREGGRSLCWAGNGDVDLFRYGCELRFLGSGR